MTVPETPATSGITPVGGVYNRQFWIAYVANFALVTANSSMFRFAELVAYLGGSERAAGAIVGTGLFGVLVVRLYLGRGIDRYGTRTAWTLSSVLFVVGCISYLGCHSVSYGLYIARTIYSIGVAGMFTCSIVHVQNMVPVYRRTEAIGALGTSGFLGMIAGSNLADGIFALYPPSDATFVALFGTAAALGLFYLLLVVYLTRRDLHVIPHESPPVFKLLVHYWPGSVVLIAITMGMALSVTTVFLTRFSTVRHLSGIRTFFTVYSIVGLIFRVPSTQWSKTIGRHNMILLGLIGNAIGHALLPFVVREWQFVYSATACGFGHALLYPAIVSLGAGAFPRQYRGLGTTISLGFIELGTAATPPLLGWIIDRYDFDPMFYAVAAFGLIVAIYYGLTAARRPDHDNDPEPAAFVEEDVVTSPAAAPANVP